MNPAIDDYFMQREEPERSCLIALRFIILNYDPLIKEEWKYRMPFYCINGKMVCYLWTHKEYRQPYFGIVEGKLIDHPLLIAEKRARMKILLVDPEKDIPVKFINSILKTLVNYYT